MALLPTLALAPRWLRGPSHFAWDVGDTAGTMSHVRALCLEPTADRINPFINYPFGFDNSAYPFWNLLDESRVHLASLFGCSTDSLTIIFALTPLIAMIGNCVAAFIFGFSIHRNNLDGAIIAIFGAFSPAILLQTRTSLSNNVLFFGFLSLASLTLFLNDRKPHWLVTFFCLLTLQIWTNVYTGAGFILVALIVLLSHIISHPKSHSVRIVIPTLVSLIISVLFGLLPLLKTQWFLLSGNPLSTFARPTDTELSGLRQVLLSPNLTTLGSLVSISALVTLKALGRIRFRDLLPLFGGLLILSLTIDVPWFGPLQWLYDSIFGPLRGVGYFVSFVPFLLAFNLVHVRPMPYLEQLRSPPFLRRAAILVLIADAVMSIPRTGFQVNSTFIRAVELHEVAAPFPDDLPSNGVVFQIPDYYYSGTERLFGAPGREILIDQMIHGLPVINGRDFVTAVRNCDEVYSPGRLINFDLLSARGGTIIALRLRDLPSTQATRVQEELTSKGWNEVTVQTSDPLVGLSVWLAPTDPTVDVQLACGGAS